MLPRDPAASACERRRQLRRFHGSKDPEWIEWAVRHHQGARAQMGYLPGIRYTRTDPRPGFHPDTGFVLYRSRAFVRCGFSGPAWRPASRWRLATKCR